MADNAYKAPADISRLRTIALGVGGIGLLAWAVGLYFDAEQALLSWLLGFIFWAGLTFGGLGVLMLQYLTGGAWGVMLRRIAEAATRVFPLVIILFIPLAIGVYTETVYEFTHLPATDYTVEHRGWFMTAESWILRSVVYFVVFGIAIHLLNKWSLAQDGTATYEDAASLLERSSRFSGPTMVFYCLAVTFASVDWVMMLDPHFFSTMWGLLFIAGWGLSFFCFGVIILAYLSDKAPMASLLDKRHFHDIGKLMLALVMVWAYFNFSQFLIIWSGNIPEETGWYLVRMQGAWGWIGILLVFLHFAFPFLVLLQQDFKRKAKLLAWLAAFILLMRLVDMYYLIGPNPRIDMHGLERGAFMFSWMDIVAPIAIGGFWLWVFFGELMKRPLVPVMDPFLDRAINHGKGH